MHVHTLISAQLLFLGAQMPVNILTTLFITAWIQLKYTWSISRDYALLKVSMCLFVSKTDFRNLVGEC